MFKGWVEEEKEKKRDQRSFRKEKVKKREEGGEEGSVCYRTCLHTGRQL